MTTSNSSRDKIQLLTEELIEGNPELAQYVLASFARLGVQPGWHYVLDLIWILDELDNAGGLRVLEIGAARGALQFLLATRGHEVTSVDVLRPGYTRGHQRMVRFVDLGDDVRDLHAYATHHGREDATDGGWPMLRRVLDVSPLRAVRWAQRRLRNDPALHDPMPAPSPDRPTLRHYRADAKYMPALANDSFDVVVSVSALEHNPPEDLDPILRECRRVLRPGGKMLHTVSAACDDSTFHEPSLSWLQDEAGFTKTFSLRDPDSDLSQRDEVHDALQNRSRYLQPWLAEMYFGSGRSGMPWGIWDVPYLPVGLRMTSPPSD